MTRSPRPSSRRRSAHPARFPGPRALRALPPATATTTRARTTSTPTTTTTSFPTRPRPALKTDPCKLDTDGDGVSDAFEVESALDLNIRALPYPGKRPYPNALDGSDATIDFDGDGLSLIEEYTLWLYTNNGNLPLTYSDGDQDTNPDGDLTPAGGSPLDIDGDGTLADDEKDADNDGMGNYDESHGRLTTGVVGRSAAGRAARSPTRRTTSAWRR